jgi:hypothetical protein
MPPNAPSIIGLDDSPAVDPRGDGGRAERASNAGRGRNGDRRGNCYVNAVMERFFSSVKSEVADRFDICGDAKMELFESSSAAERRGT